MKYTAFIRGINVGGSNVIKMDELKKLLSGMGFENVQTYIQSGNVVFDSDEIDSGKVEKIMEAGLSDHLKNDITVFIREFDYLKNLSQKNIFDLESDEDLKFYVIFLKEPPEEKLEMPVVSEKDGWELIEVIDREMFVVSRRLKNGRYGFPNNYIEKLISAPATSRNWKTFLKMMAKFDS